MLEGKPRVVVTSHLCVWQTGVLLKPQRLGAQALGSGRIRHSVLLTHLLTLDKLITVRQFLYPGHGKIKPALLVSSGDDLRC